LGVSIEPLFLKELQYASCLEIASAPENFFTEAKRNEHSLGKSAGSKLMLPGMGSLLGESLLPTIERLEASSRRQLEWGLVLGRMSYR
jgi:hypothetical protein